MLDVSILGREYRVACKESERDELMQAVQYLDQRMREIRDAGKIAGTERIAVMAALNITHELLGAKARRRGLQMVLTARAFSVEFPPCSRPSIVRWRNRTNCSSDCADCPLQCSNWPYVL